MASRNFATLVSHPPTPPRKPEYTQNALQFLSDDYELDRLEVPRIPASHALLDTPPQSSPLQQDSANSKLSKRLRFLPAQTLPEFSDLKLRQLLPSKAQKSSKSILKPSEPSPSCDNADQDPFLSLATLGTPATFKDMLESILKQLARSDSHDRLNAYQTLHGSLMAYNDFPHTEDLRARLTPLEGFMRRDVMQDHTGSPTTRLPLQAMKLVALLLSSQPSLRFSNDFLTVLFGQAITIVTKAQPSKEMALLCMQFLSMRVLYPKQTLSDRTQKAFSALENIQDRVSGSNVIRVKYIFYSRMTEIAPVLLVEKVQQWIPEILHGMLSDNKDLRQRAIDTAVIAGEILGHYKIVSKAVFDLLHAEGAEGVKYHTHFEQRLQQLLKEPEDARSVSQTWGAVMLLLRGRPSLIEQWFNSTSWLRLLEACFNSSDTTLNCDAWLAWNRSIYALSGSLTKPHILKRLRAPIIARLQVSSHSCAKDAALSTYCGLLYYALAPRTSTTSLDPADVIWRMLVLEVIPKIVAKTKADAHRLAEILSAMLRTSSVRVWNGKRMIEIAKNPFKLDEVPRLDPSWVRKNILSVSSVISPIILTLWCSPRDDNAACVTLWTALLKALSEAGSKEIKLSMESKSALAEIVNSLCRMWRAGTTRQERNRTRRTPDVIAFTLLVQAAAECLGPMHFVNNILSRTNGGSFEAAATASSTTPARSGHLQSPVVTLLRLFLTPSGTTIYDNTPDLGTMKVLRPCWATKASRRLRLQFLKECAGMLSTLELDLAQQFAGAQIWQSIAELTKETMEQEMEAKQNELSYQLGFEYRDVLVILQAGLQFSNAMCLQSGRSLFNAWRFSVREQAGEVAVVLAVTEPLIKCLTFDSPTCSSSSALHYLACVFDAGVTVSSKPAFERARKALGDSFHFTATADLSGLGWLRAMYAKANEMLTHSYAHLDEFSHSAVEAFVLSLANSLHGRTDSSIVAVPAPQLLLSNLKDGIATWIEDKDSKIFGRGNQDLKLRSACIKMWNGVLTTILRFPLKSSSVLHLVEDIFYASFTSRSNTIANSSITAWNSSFGFANSLEYPPRLGRLLRRMEALVDISLPSFPPAADGDRQPSSIEEKLDEEDHKVFPWLATEDTHFLHEQNSKSLPSSSAKLQPSKFIFGPSTIPRTLSPRRTSNIPKNQANTPPARLRHDNSQIQFVAVDSSPSNPTAMDSEILTDHQKEVRSRQVEDLALFKDIRSTPLQSNRNPNPDRLTTSDVVPQPSSASPTTAETATFRLEYLGHDSPVPGNDTDDAIDSSPLGPSRMRKHSHFGNPPFNLSERLDGNIDIHMEDITSSPPESPRQPAACESITPPIPPTNIGQPTAAEMVPATELPGENVDRLNRLHKPEADQELTIMEPKVPQIVLLADAGSAVIENNGIRNDDEESGLEATFNEYVHPPSLPAKEIDVDAADEQDDAFAEARAQIPEAHTSDCLQNAQQRFFPLSEDNTFVENSFITPRVEEKISKVPVETAVDRPAELERQLLEEQPSSAVVSERISKVSPQVVTQVFIPPLAQGSEYALSQPESEHSAEGSDSIVGETPYPRKRRFLISSLQSKTKRQKVKSDGDMIVCQTPGRASPSLRMLAMRSAILVEGKNIISRSSASTSSSLLQSHSGKQLGPLSKRRRETHADEDNQGVVDDVASQASNRATKRLKSSTPSRTSPSVFQGSQRRSGRLSGHVSALQSGVSPKKRRARANMSRLSSANSSFIEDDSQPQDRITKPVIPTVENNFNNDNSGEAVEANSSAQFQDSDSSGTGCKAIRSQPSDDRPFSVPSALTAVVHSSPWDDSTVDMTANLFKPPPFPPPAIPASKPDVLSTSSHTKEIPTITSTTSIPISSVHQGQLQQPQQGSRSPPLTPTSLARGIIGRLRGILADCRTLVLGPHVEQQESGAVEDLQDLAHELQGEILRARKRGRV